MLAQGRGREDVLFWQGNRIPGIHSLLPGHSREIQAIIRGKKVWGLDLRTAVSWCQVGLWSEGQFGLRALLQWKKNKNFKKGRFFLSGAVSDDAPGNYIDTGASASGFFSWMGTAG